MIKTKMNMRQAIILLLLSAFILQITLAQQISYDPSAITASSQIQIVKDPLATTTKFYQTPSTIHQLIYDSTAKKTTFKVTGFDPNQANFQKSQSTSPFAGEWTFTATRNDSCALAKSTTGLAFLSFNRSSQAVSFKNVSATANLLSKSSDTLSANILCSAIQFKDISSSIIYSLNSAGALVENSFTGTTVLSDDFDYIWEQSSKSIKVYNRNTNKYDAFLTLNSAFSSVRLFSNMRIFVFLGINTVINPSDATKIDSTSIEVRVYERKSNSLLKSHSLQTFGNQFIYSASQDLSKILIFYKDKTQKIVLIGNSFNLEDKKSFDIVFKDQSHLSTILSAGVGRFSLTLERNIFLITSATLQQAYLLNGLNANFFKSMNIPAQYQGSYGSYLIDGKKMPSLRVFLISKLSTDRFTVVYFDYGQVSPKAPEALAPFLSLQVPRAYEEQFVSKDMLFWGYSHFTVTPAPMTNFTMLAYSPLLPSKYANVSRQIQYVWNVMAMNTNCGAFKNVQAGQFFILLFNHMTNTETQINISPLIISTNPTLSSVFAISEDCLSFRADKYIFKLKLDTKDAYRPITNSPFNDWVSVDQDINYVIKNKEIWKYDPTTNAFALYYTLNGTFNNPTLSSYKDRIVVASQSDSTNSIQISTIYKPLDKSTTSFYQKSIGGFSAVPKVQFSPNVTKIVIYGFEQGDTDQSKPKNVILYMDYNKAQGGQIKLDDYISKYNAKRDFQYIEDNYIYIRQLIPATPGDFQSLYYFSKDRKAYRLLKRSLSPNEESQWKNTVLEYGANNQDILVFSVLFQDYHLNIFKQEASSKLLEQQQQQQYGYSYTIVDGKIVKCSKGCSDCSTGVCVSCFDGFSFDSASKSCVACDQSSRCAACDSITPSICTKCFPGTFLSGPTCISCDKSCFQCSSSATNCISCMFGKYSDGGSCVSCSQNCAVCTDASTCTKCAKGSVLSGVSCLKCLVQCSSCSPNNITQCTDCIDGMRLMDGSCVSCAKNCLSCDYSNTCTKCKGGYRLGSNGSCAQQCSSKCLACKQKQPQQCTECFPGTILKDNKCVLDSTCNKTNTCTECGTTLNYYLNQFSQCIPCPNIQNCLQCQQPPNTGKCLTCKEGRYVSADNICVKCSKNCSSCMSDTICSLCAPGYTFILGQTVGSCQPCQGGCLQCLGDTTYCLSCKDKFTKQGAICESNNKMSFKVTLNTPSSTILPDIGTFKTNFLTKLTNGNSQLKKNINVNFHSIKSGSTIVQGVVTSNTQSQQNLQTINQNYQNNVVTGGTIGTYAVTASSSSVTDIQDDDDHDGDDKKVGLIVGLVVGLSVLLVIIIVVVIKMRRNQKNNANIEEKEEKAKSETNNAQINLVPNYDGSENKLENEFEFENKL